MVFNIEKFSSALCLAHATYQDYKDLPSHCFMLTFNSKYVLRVILKLGKIFDKELEAIVKVVSVPEVSDLDGPFLEATLARYITLSLSPTYFSFLILCSLVERTVSQMFREEECFYKVKLSSVALNIVYNRRYRVFFKNQEKTECLGCYCKTLDARLLSENGRSRLPPKFQEQVRLFLTNLKDFECKNFSLTDSEEQFLWDSFAIPPPEGKPNYDEKKSHCESDSSIKEGNVEEEISSLSIDDHDDSEVYKYCIICDGRCYMFLELYRQEVNVKSRHLCSKKSRSSPLRI